MRLYEKRCDCCCCTYKGNQIFANHNNAYNKDSEDPVVVVPTKVIKFLLITTVVPLVTKVFRCCCTYKGNQIFANHNCVFAHPLHHLLLLYLQR